MTKLSAAAARKLVEAFNGNGIIADIMPSTRNALIAAKCAELVAGEHGTTKTIISPIGRLRAKSIIRKG
jgi:hypothetical protein